MVKQKKSWLLRVAPDKNKVYVIQDLAPDGRGTYFFLLVAPLKEQGFISAMKKNEPMDLSQFGRVITSGYGEPSEALLEKMRHQFGANT